MILERCPYPETTLAKGFLNKVAKYKNRTFVLSKFQDGKFTDKYSPTSWLDLFEKARGFARFLITNGVERQDRVAIFADNSPWWIATTNGIQLAGGVSVTIYPTLLADEVAYIIKDSDAKLVVAGNQEQLNKIRQIREKLPLLKWVIVLDKEVGLKKEAGELSFENVAKSSDEKIDREIVNRIEKTEADDISTILYTSGTTGTAKGVPLTHNNFLYQRALSEQFDFNENDIWLNHIPLCHSYGLVADLFASVHVGATFAMSPSIGTNDMREALLTIRPTVLTTVPRLFEKIYHQVESNLERQPKQRQKIFWKAVKTSKRYHELTRQKASIPLSLKLRWRFYDGLVFKKVRKMMGLNRLRSAASGGGPLSKELILFFEALGIKIYQGYGLTETSPIINANTPKNNKPGSVGKPLLKTEEKIAEDGEILVRGPGVFKGYWKKPEATEETFTQDGFFKTGDIGYIDDEGHLFITDRKKEILVTAAGKNVAPQPIESALMNDPYIEQACIVGDGRKFISALVVPAFELLDQWAQSKNLVFKDRKEMVKSPEVVALYKLRIDEVNKEFARFEQVKKFALMGHEFTVETGELTPTQKFKRRVIEEKYKDIIDSFYKEGEEKSG